MLACAHTSDIIAHAELLGFFFFFFLFFLLRGELGGMNLLNVTIFEKKKL